MAAAMRRDCTIEYMGWDTHQYHKPMPFPETLGIKIWFHHHEYANDFTGQCAFHGGCFLAKQEVMLDDNEARNFLSTKLSVLGIPIDVQPPIISETVFHYRITNSSITRKSETEIPVIVFKIIYETWLSSNEEEAAARAIEESMEADTCKPTPAARCAIDALQKVTLDCSKSNETCTICLEELGQQVTRMPCSHIFHRDCIVKWLETSHLCPLCRFEMPTDQLRQCCDED